MDRREFIASALTGAAAGSTVLASAQAKAQTGGDASFRAWEIGPKGEFDTMRLVNRPAAAPGPGEVVVKVAASGLAGRDRAIARGWFLQDKSPNRVPLSEGVGTVVAVGEGAQRIDVGDRVTCVHFPRWADGAWTPANYVADIGNTQDGWLTEYATLPASGVVRVPDSIDDATAATLAGSAITAWHALNHVAKVKPGDTVLTLGTGGVSSWGILLAKAAGAKVIVTSSSDDKLRTMGDELGADITVNYRRNPEWGSVITELTNGAGADIVLENVGWPTLNESLQATAVNATVVMIGTGPRPTELLTMPDFYIKNVTMKAISNGSRAMMEQLVDAVAANGLKALIAREFAFEDAVEALQFLDKSGHAGKVVVKHA